MPSKRRWQCARCYGTRKLAPCLSARLEITPRQRSAPGDGGIPWGRLEASCRLLVLNGERRVGKPEDPEEGLEDAAGLEGPAGAVGDAPQRRAGEVAHAGAAGFELLDDVGLIPAQELLANDLVARRLEGHRLGARLDPRLDCGLADLSLEVEGVGLVDDHRHRLFEACVRRQAEVLLHAD